MGAFGEKLRKQREERGIAIDAISNTTKISVRMLRALEDEHFDQLPGGVFNKGFVRAYARQVGLDEEETVTDYLAALRESQIQAQKILPDFRTRPAKPTTIAAPDLRSGVLPSNVRRTPDGSGNGTLGVSPADRRNQDRRNQDRRNEDRRNQGRPNEDHPSETLSDDHRRPEDPRPELEDSPRYLDASSSLDSTTNFLPDAFIPTAEPSARVPWRKLGAALLLVAAAVAVWNSHRQRQPVAPSQIATAPNQSPAPLSSTPLPSIPAASHNFGESSPAATSRLLPSSPVPPANNVGHSPAAKPPAAFTVLIRAEKTTWVSILADGKPVANETLIAPANTSVRASREVVVKTGNAAGVSFLLNGKLIRPQGNDGEVKTYVFDATGLRPTP